MRSKTHHRPGYSAQEDISPYGGNLKGSTDKWEKEEERTRKKKKNAHAERKERRIKSEQER